MKQYRSAAGGETKCKGKIHYECCSDEESKEREGMKVDGEMERTIKTGLERWRLEKTMSARRGLRFSYLLSSESLTYPFLNTATG